MAIQDVLRLHTLMMTRRSLLGALKCAFRDLRRELATTACVLAIVDVDLATVKLVEKVRADDNIGVARVCQRPASSLL